MRILAKTPELLPVKLRCYGGEDADFHVLSQDILRTCPGSRSIKGLPWRLFFGGVNLKKPSTERDNCVEGAHRKLNQFAILARCMLRCMQLHVHVILVKYNGQFSVNIRKQSICHDCNGRNKVECRTRAKFKRNIVHTYIHNTPVCVCTYV